jgi:hypothetical protein
MFFGIFLQFGGFGHLPYNLVETGVSPFFEFPYQRGLAGTGPSRDYDASGHPVKVCKTKVRIPPCTFKRYL